MRTVEVGSSTMITPGIDTRHEARKLLDRVPFNVLMAKAVVDGRVRGETLADATNPTSIYAKHKYGMSFLIGYSDDEDFRSNIVAMLADGTGRDSPEWLQVYPLDWTELLDPLVEEGRLRRWGRTNFWFNRSRFLSRFPQGEHQHHTVPCTTADLADFAGSVLPGHFWNDIDDFIASETGFFSVDAATGEPAAIAFASYLDHECLEIGVETLPRFRGRGYARAACARLIHLCLERGLMPVWSCRTENEGSYRLAESLGLVPVLQVPYYELPWSE
jgi:RimJ/RimL family protein N-acetyltransferase